MSVLRSTFVLIAGFWAGVVCVSPERGKDLASRLGKLILRGGDGALGAMERRAGFASEPSSSKRRRSVFRFRPSSD